MKAQPNRPGQTISDQIVIDAEERHKQTVKRLLEQLTAPSSGKEGGAHHEPIRRIP